MCIPKESCSPVRIAKENYLPTMAVNCPLAAVLLWRMAKLERSCSYLTVVIARSGRYCLNNFSTACLAFKLKTLVVSPVRVPFRENCRVASIFGIVYRCSRSGTGKFDTCTMSAMEKMSTRRRDSRRRSAWQTGKIGDECTIRTPHESITCPCADHRIVFGPADESVTGVWCGVHGVSGSVGKCA